MPEKLEWTPELVNKFWDGVAQTRLNELSFALLNGDKLVQYISNHLTQEVHCLDFGAGDGHLIPHLLAKGCQVTAYEPSPERQKQLLNKDFATHPNFIGCIDHSAQDTFDVVIAAEVIEHVLEVDLVTVLQRLHTLLKSNGTLIITTPNNEDLDKSSVYCPVSNQFFHRWQHVRAFTPDSLNALLATAKFKRIADHRVDFSSNSQLSERYRDLRRLFLLACISGPFALLLAPLVKRLRRLRTTDLRIGAESTLIYVGQPCQQINIPTQHS